MTRGTNSANTGVSGAFYDAGAGSGINAAGNSRSNIGFDASRVSSVYKTSAEVKPESYPTLYYIKY